MVSRSRLRTLMSNVEMLLWLIRLCVCCTECALVSRPRPRTLMYNVEILLWFTRLCFGFTGCTLGSWPRPCTLMYNVEILLWFTKLFVSCTGCALGSRPPPCTSVPKRQYVTWWRTGARIAASAGIRWELAPLSFFMSYERSHHFGGKKPGSTRKKKTMAIRRLLEDLFTYDSKQNRSWARLQLTVTLNFSSAPIDWGLRFIGFVYEYCTYYCGWVSLCRQSSHSRP